MQSFATQLLFTIFFKDNESKGGGLGYMKCTVQPIMQRIVQLSEDKLELVPNGVSVSADEASQNLMNLLDICRQLFSLLSKKLPTLPSLLRLGFYCMREFGAKKFPEIADSIVPICFFLRCLCPTLLQPEQFGLSTQKPPTYSFKALVAISKLLQNIANGIIKNNIVLGYPPSDAVILTFIQEHVVVVKQFCEQIINKDLMLKDGKFEPTLPENQKKVEQQDSLEQLYHLIMEGEFKQHLNKLEQEQIKRENNTKISLSIYEGFINNIENKRNHMNLTWKKGKETDGFTPYWFKKIPFVYTIKGDVYTSLRNARTCLEAISYQEWVSAIFSDKCLHTEKCQLLAKEDNDYEIWSLKVKFPFPFSPKTVTIKKLPLNIEKHKIGCMFSVEGTSASTLEMSITCFKKTKTQCELCMNYMLIPEGNSNYTKAANSTHCKNLLSALLRLRAVLMGSNTNEVSTIKTSSFRSDSFSHTVLPIEVTTHSLVTPRNITQESSLTIRLQNQAFALSARNRSQSMNEVDPIPDQSSGSPSNGSRTARNSSNCEEDTKISKPTTSTALKNLTISRKSSDMMTIQETQKNEKVSKLRRTRTHSSKDKPEELPQTAKAKESKENRNSETDIEILFNQYREHEVISISVSNEDLTKKTEINPRKITLSPKKRNGKNSTRSPKSHHKNRKNTWRGSEPLRKRAEREETSNADASSPSESVKHTHKKIEESDETDTGWSGSGPSEEEFEPNFKIEEGEVVFSSFESEIDLLSEDEDSFRHNQKKKTIKTKYRKYKMMKKHSKSEETLDSSIDLLSLSH
uniref:Ras-GAP domain-containing protein n=1 Tax=Arcella intermedia TaxID=1963864 RepID=A0A6B2KYE3_9EUKA